MKKRMAYLLRIRAGKEAEYVEAHQEVWPELIALLQTVGFRNYTIFKRELNLFVYVEVEDFNRSLQQLVDSPVYQKWAQKMEAIMEPHPESRTGEKFPILSEVFHVD